MGRDELTPYTYLEAVLKDLSSTTQALTDSLRPAGWQAASYGVLSK